MSVPQMLARMEHNIGWVFHSKLTAIEALNSAGQPINYDGQWHNLRRNDNLAIIGDKALDQVLSLMWYHSSNPQGGFLTKGVWSTLQQDLITNEKLAIRGFSYALDRCVITNAGHVGRISEHMMATAVEAIVGAVFKDSGFDKEAVRAVMARLGFFSHPLLAGTDCSSLPGHTKPTLEA